MNTPERLSPEQINEIGSKHCGYAWQQYTFLRSLCRIIEDTVRKQWAEWLAGQPSVANLTVSVVDGGHSYEVNLVNGMFNITAIGDHPLYTHPLPQQAQEPSDNTPISDPHVTVPVKRRRMALLSAALGHPTPLDVIEGETYDDGLIELATGLINANTAVMQQALEALTTLVPMFAQWHEEFPEHVGDKEIPALQLSHAAITALREALPKTGVVG